MTTLQVLLLSLIEGITEYLPISSTGHMIITSYFLGIEQDQFVQNFEVIIQFGAILSVLVIYYRDFFKTNNEKISWSPLFKSNLPFYKQLFAAFLPTAAIGFLFKNLAERMLGSVQVVAWALIIGGVILIWLDSFLAKKARSPGPLVQTLENFSLVNCVKIGLFQTLALIPGVSRSGASIAGGVLLGLSRVEAAKFSFLLGVPTLAAASFYKLIKILPTIESKQIFALTLGSLVAFFMAWIAIKTFIELIRRFGFKYFGVYRIALGLLILLLVANAKPT